MPHAYMFAKLLVHNFTLQDLLTNEAIIKGINVALTTLKCHLTHLHEHKGMNGDEIFFCSPIPTFQYGKKKGKTKGKQF